MANQTAEHEITIEPLTGSGKRYKINGEVLAKASGTIAALLLLQEKGVPFALINGQGAWKAFKDTSRKLDQTERAQWQGFNLYITALSMAVKTVFRHHAAEVLDNEQSREEISELIIGALRSEPITLTGAFWAKPAQSSGFRRTRDALHHRLSSLPAGSLSETAIATIRATLGGEFAIQLDRLLSTPMGSSSNAGQDDGEGFEAFANYLSGNPATEAANRVRAWRRYQDTLCKDVHDKLFLHEFENHPDLTLNDVYVPSRALYRKIIEHDGDEDIAGSVKPENVRIHAFDLARHLRASWLERDDNNIGAARLIEGGPGTGKSTFALMFAYQLSCEGYRVLRVQANRIRSLELDMKTILRTHFRDTAMESATLDLETALDDPDATGKPLIIILDGLDEYDTDQKTIAQAAAGLANHALVWANDRNQAGQQVRLILLGRPEATAAASTDYREAFHHLEITEFTIDEPKWGGEPADDDSRSCLEQDQREHWWQNWSGAGSKNAHPLPDAIAANANDVVREITAQPLLLYIIAALGLHESGKLDNLTALFDELFSRYFERQKVKSDSFRRVCNEPEVFQRLMSEISLAAWHAGDSSIELTALRDRLDQKRFREWLQQAGTVDQGLSALLSSFYLRPEGRIAGNSGLGERYIFTPKSFREYFTGEGIVGFIGTVTRQLNSDDDGSWDEATALAKWHGFFGPRALDNRQYDFVEAAFARDDVKIKDLIRRKQAVETLFATAFHGTMAVPRNCPSIDALYSQIANAEEALIVILDALRFAICRKWHRDTGAEGLSPLDDHNPIKIPVEDRPWTAKIDWRGTASGRRREPLSYLEIAGKLSHLVARLRHRPSQLGGAYQANFGVLFEVPLPQIPREGLILSFHFENIDLSHATFAGQTIPFSSFRSCRLVGANLAGADLARANLMFARLQGADLQRTNLTDANLTRAHLTSADLTGARLPGANLWGANLTGSNLQGSNLKGAELTDANLTGARLQGAHLTGADFRGANIASKLKAMARKKGAIVDDDD